MTAFAFILGTIPLAIAFGAGANSRRSIGTTVVGGMSMATLLIIVIPVFFIMVEKTRERLSPRLREEIEEEIQEEATQRESAKKANDLLSQKDDETAPSDESDPSGQDNGPTQGE